MIAAMIGAEGDESPGGDAVTAAMSKAIREMWLEDGREQAVFVAAADGLSLSTFQRILAGKSCTVPLLVVIARALGVDPSVILVRAELSAEILDPVSAVSQARNLTARQRRSLIDLIRELSESPKADR